MRCNRYLVHYLFQFTLCIVLRETTVKKRGLKKKMTNYSAYPNEKSSSGSFYELPAKSPSGSLFYQTMPCAFMASATFKKPAILAPAT